MLRTVTHLPLLLLSLLLAPVVSMSSACGGDRVPPDMGAGDAGTPPDVDAGPVVPDVEPCSERDPRAVAPEVFVGPVGLRTRLQAFIAAAATTLRVEVYQLADAALIYSLTDAARRGVDVRVMLDARQGVNAAARRQLEAAGAVVHDGPARFEHFHVKVLVADDARAIVMSANMNEYSMETERNHGVVLEDHWDVADLAAVFDHDWNGGVGAPPALACSRLVVSPDNSRTRLERLTADATTELRIQQLEFADASMRNAIAVRAREGVHVRVILADPAWIDSNVEAAQALVAMGAEVRFLTYLDNHAKLVVSDAAAAFVGSENFSYTSLEHNREVGVVVTDAPGVGSLLDAFEADWLRARTP